MTVLGPIAPEKLGLTHPHEHLLCDLSRDRPIIGLLNDESLAIRELAAYKAAGGRSIVEVTNRGLGRNPAALKRIAQASGVNVVMGCGWYRGSYYDTTVDRTRTDALAADVVEDLTKGADGTGIRAGIIGEIGADGSYLTGVEERVLRAAARAHKQTGAAITLHAVAHPVGLDQLDVLEEEGADLRRAVVGHCDTFMNLDYHVAILRRGAYVEYDTFGRQHHYPDEWRVEHVVELLRRGYASQLLLSSDIAVRLELHAYGGYGYDYLARKIHPALKKAGASDEQIHMMTVENPARLLPF